MKDKKYNISMQTPIGKKHGLITVSSDGGVIRGILSVLNHSEPFEGMIDQNGCCSIKGKIVTLLKTVQYTANGVINEENIRLKVEAVNKIFEVTGEAVR